MILICEHVGFEWENNTDVEVSVNVDPLKLCRTSIFWIWREVAMA